MSSNTPRERLLTRAETAAKLLEELDQRVWKTADDDCQLRLYSRYEVECVRAALQSFYSEKQPIQTTGPATRSEVSQGESRLHHPAPEREGEIAARESLEPEGRMVVPLETDGEPRGRAERLDGGERPASSSDDKEYRQDLVDALGDLARSLDAQDRKADSLTCTRAAIELAAPSATGTNKQLLAAARELLAAVDASANHVYWFKPLGALNAAVAAIDSGSHHD